MAESVHAAVEAVADQPTEVRAAVGAAAATAAIPAPTGSGVNALWKFLVVGIVIVLLAAVGGIIYVVADGNDATTPDVLVTVFSSALTGLIGLFVRSPAS